MAEEPSPSLIGGDSLRLVMMRRASSSIAVSGRWRQPAGLGNGMTGQAVTGTSAPLSLEERRELAALRLELGEARRQKAALTIENSRLFEEVQARTKELTESLEYQTATSEVLSVISSSPDRLQPVIDAIHDGAPCDWPSCAIPPDHRLT